MKKKIAVLLFGLSLAAALLCSCRSNQKDNVGLVDGDGIAETAETQSGAAESGLEENDGTDGQTGEETLEDGGEPGRTYITEEYGYIENRDHEYVNEYDEVLYSYGMECFNFYNDDIPEAVTIALNDFYDGREALYQSEGESYMEEDFVARCKGENGEIPVEEEEPPSGQHPYSQWIFLGIKYVGDDYISLLYDSADYMEGAHAYSMYDGITIDRKTGEEASISEILGKDEDEILREISGRMGTDSLVTWEEVDFYLTEDSAVFFYRMPGYWEDIVVPR